MQISKTQKNIKLKPPNDPVFILLSYPNNEVCQDTFFAQAFNMLSEYKCICIHTYVNVMANNRRVLKARPVSNKKQWIINNESCYM